jgi:hypothetical protein
VSAAVVVAAVPVAIASLVPRTRNNRYIILRTGKSCERAIAEALVIEEIIDLQKLTK